MPVPETTPLFRASLNGLALVPAPDCLVMGGPSRVLLVAGTVCSGLPLVLFDLAIPPSMVLEGWVAASALPPCIDALVGDILEKRVCLPALKPIEKFRPSGWLLWAAATSFGSGLTASLFDVLLSMGFLILLGMGWFLDSRWNSLGSMPFLAPLYGL